MRRTVGLALMALGLVALAMHCLPYASRHSVDKAAIGSWGGAAYAVRISQYLPGPVGAVMLQVRTDTVEEGQASRLRVFEGSRELGPRHSVHAEIVSKGQGRFSHWGRDLVFSASDNSDPRTNGRAYSFEVALVPAWWVVAALLLPGMLLLRTTGPVAWLASHRGHAFWTAAAALAAWMNYSFAVQLPAPIPSDDSISYLTWSILRTWGYPILVHAHYFASGSWSHLPLLQLNLGLGGLFVLAHAVTRLSGSYALGWLAICIAAAGVTMLLSATNLLTEAPFAAFLMGHVGFVMLYFHGRRHLHALGAGLALAAAIAIKSVALVLLGPLVLAMLAAPHLRRPLFMLAFLPATAAWLAPSTYNLARYGTFETSHSAGFALAGHVAWAVAPRETSRVAEDAALVQQRIAPILASRPTSYESSLAYVDYTANEYNRLLWANMIPELDKHYDGLRVKEPCSWDGRERYCVVRHSLSLNRALLAMGREAISSEPRRYARHVLAHFHGLWRDLSAPAGEFVPALHQRASTLRDAYDPGKTTLAPLYVLNLGQPVLKSESELLADTARLQGMAAKALLDLVTFREAAAAAIAATYRHPMVPLILAILASLLLFRFGRAVPATQALCYCALCLNAYFLGTALAQPSLVRYAGAAQGLAAAMVVLALHVAWRAVYDFASRRLGDQD